MFISEIRRVESDMRFSPRDSGVEDREEMMDEGVVEGDLTEPAGEEIIELLELEL